MLLAILLTPAVKLQAQDPISLIILQGITKVIRAVDLKIQRLQTKTIWLQNAQKVVENTMSRLRLEEISRWVEKQRVLYRDYFEELQKVKQVITYSHKVQEIAQLQLALVKQYRRSLEGIKKDARFSPGEVRYMTTVYTGILEESLRNLDGLNLVLTSFATQMTDENRLELIDGVRRAIQKNYDDLRRFSLQNVQLSLSRAKERGEILVIKNLYGLQ